MAAKRKQVLIVAPYPRGKAPSQRFRFEQYLRHLQENGYKFSYSSFWTEKSWPKIYQQGNLFQKVAATLFGIIKRFFLIFKLPKFDVVFIHREALPVGPPVWEWIAVNILNKKVIFDFDDAIWLKNSSEANAKLVGRFKNHSKTAKIISLSKVVIAGNQFLANYASKFNSNVVVIPTTIDTESHHKLIKTHSEKSAVTIGWTGTHSTLQQLEPLFPVLEKLYINQTFKFLLISDFPPRHYPAFVEFVKWKKETEIDDLLRIDIGIMPLFNTEWEKGKCGFKALQYMSLGIPPVVSGVGVNKSIVQNGKTGFVVSPGHINDWEIHLKSLISDFKLREKLGEAAREFVKTQYSVNSQKRKYLNMLSGIIEAE